MQWISQQVASDFCALEFFHPDAPRKSCTMIGKHDQDSPSDKAWKLCTKDGREIHIVTLRGSARGSILENLPQHGEIMLSISKICPLCVQKVQNPPKFLPKPCQNLPKTLPKRSQIYPEALLELILSQCLKEARFWMAKKPAKQWPKAPKGNSRRPQNSSKWNPRPSQNSWTFERFFPAPNLHRFFHFLFIIQFSWLSI